ncbi:hypothetical protein RFI_24963 [Reticulomyxa filosa]|uniref:Uncharacterized protein n=1 Tax=Reticulomyxa filosa TaxID=46433 RepID=X6MFJ8_RETFI|nr:hypothetical protein RFI_24963 [Reticulomyxa filosa]|eukprot:ETO12411.1 hypothetical protein RFI_24963 [Reticulomyxa filosa]
MKDTSKALPNGVTALDSLLRPYRHIVLDTTTPNNGKELASGDGKESTSVDEKDEKKEASSDAAGVGSFAAYLFKNYLPDCVIIGLNDDNIDAMSLLNEEFRQFQLANNQSTKQVSTDRYLLAQICEETMCQRPTNDLDTFVQTQTKPQQFLYVKYKMLIRFKVMLSNVALFCLKILNAHFLVLCQQISSKHVGFLKYQNVFIRNLKLI